MKVIELKPYDRITDLKLNQSYLGTLLSSGFVALNSSIKGKLLQPTDQKQGAKVAVKVVKVTLPYKVGLELLSGDYNVTEETPEHKFLVKSETLDKLKPKMVKAVALIKDAISKSRPIIIRHHADCDGFVGAIALEKAISPLIMAKHRSSIWHHYKRAPNRAPFYTYMDALKDISMNLDAVRHDKPPLLIYVDSGSTKQDLLGFKRVSQFGFTTIVLDHHKPTIEDNKPVIESCVDLFINPHLVGGDSTLVGGMLGVELARLLNRNINMDHLPAIAGVCDKSQGKILEDYVELAKKKGYTDKLILELGQCIDFDVFFLGRLNSDIIQDILFSDIEEQKQFVELIKEEISKRKTAVLNSAEKYGKTKVAGQVKIFELELGQILNFGSYPPSGKATGMVFDSLKQKSEKIMVLGIGDDYITIRAQIPGFDLNKMIKELAIKIPYAQIEGGGHEVAGTVKFIKAAKQEVLDSIEKYLSEHHGAN